MGATLGTRLLTWLRGELVGTDAYGNRYYRLQGRQAAAARRRPVQPRAALGHLQRRAGGLEGAVGMACLAAPHGRRGAAAAAALCLGKAAPAEHDRHAAGLSPARARSCAAATAPARPAITSRGHRNSRAPRQQNHGAAMNGNVIETVMGAVVLVVAALFLFFAYNTSQMRAVPGYQVTADFERVDGIRDGSDVRISGIKVGSMLSQDLDPKTFLATVRMSDRPGDQAARRHGGRDRLVGPARRQVHVAGARRLGQDDPARRQDQIHPILGQPRKPDRPDDLFAAGKKPARAKRQARRRARAPAPRQPTGTAPGLTPCRQERLRRYKSVSRPTGIHGTRDMADTTQRIPGLAHAGRRAGLVRREDQGAEREPRRIARAGAGRARRRGADGLRRAPGARGAGRDRRRPRQPLPQDEAGAGAPLALLALVAAGAAAPRR